MSRSKLLVILAVLFLTAVPTGLALAQVAVKVRGTGTAVISDDVALSDAITYRMSGVTLPEQGTAYEGWLVSDDGSVKWSTGEMAVAEDGSIDHTFASAKVLLVALTEQNDSGHSGWAMLTARGDKTEVMLGLSAGAVESELVHIHTGPCGNDTLGPVAHGLTSIVDGSSLTVVDVRLIDLRTGDFAVNSHKKGEPAVYTTCGNIPAESEAVTIALQEQNRSGQSGWATLTSRGDQTEVVLHLSQGPLSSELVHIHSGECGNETLGPVAHGLTKFVGGSGGSVTLVDATLASLRTGDFAINSHQKGFPANYTTCGGIPLGGSYYNGDNLIHLYDKVEITVEPVPDTDQAPSAVVAFSYQIPEDGMLHIRHLLTNWPAGADKGILTNLKEQLDVAVLHANLAKNSTDTDGVRQHLEHVINAIEGSKGPNYGDLNNDGKVQDFGDGIGVLEHARDASQEGRSHAGLAASAVPNDEVINAHADLVIVTAGNAELWARQARDIALNKVLPETNLDLAKIFLGSATSANTVNSLLSAARAGNDKDRDGKIEPIAKEGAAEQAYVQAQLMATYTLRLGGLPQAPATPTAVPTIPVPTPILGPGISLPATGDTSVPALAQIALLVSAVVLGVGGVILIRGRRSRTIA